MRLRTLLCGFVCGAVTMLFTAQVASQSETDLTDQALRQAAKQAASISAFHKKIRKIKGKYDQTIKWWRAPGAVPDESNGRANTNWEVDGRFMIQRIEGRWLGSPFKGVAILGYDNATEEFTAVWMDSLGSNMMFSRGKPDELGETITLRGQHVDIITGETVQATTLLQMPDRKGETRLEMFRTGPDGAEFKFLEVATTRKVMRGA